MSNEQNIEVVRRVFRDIETGNADDIEKMVTSNWVNHDPSLPPMRGPDGARQLATLFHTAFPDVKITGERFVAEGDRVGGYFSFSGTNQGSFLGIPATGKRVNATGAGIFRVVDGKLTDNWVNFDAFSLMQQLGLVPPQGSMP